MRFDIITLFPENYTSYLQTSIIGRAKQRKIIRVYLHQLRRYASDKHRTVDDKPYGGGAGMILKAEPIIKAVDDIKRRSRHFANQRRLILFSAKGKPFTQTVAQRWARNIKQLIMICGRYEGVDERVKTILHCEEISLGPYVLTDGDIAALAVISTVSRLLPGVIREESHKDESFYSASPTKKSCLLEYPQYTRPVVIKYKGKNYRVPPVLLSGNHQLIEKWRRNHQKTTTLN